MWEEENEIQSTAVERKKMLLQGSLEKNGLCNAGFCKFENIPVDPPGLPQPWAIDHPLHSTLEIRPVSVSSQLHTLRPSILKLILHSLYQFPYYDIM